MMSDVGRHGRDETGIAPAITNLDGPVRTHGFEALSLRELPGTAHTFDVGAHGESPRLLLGLAPCFDALIGRLGVGADDRARRS